MTAIQRGIRILNNLKKPKFKNTAKPFQHKDYSGVVQPNRYGFDTPPRGMVMWSTLLQGVISQAGTWLIAEKFHKSQCGIYKCEGGVRINGHDLVLKDDYCYLDYTTDSELETKIAKLITHVVLTWDPMRPIESMLENASEYVGCDKDELRQVIEKTAGGTFGGNAICDFFNYNPFRGAPEDRDYERFCLIEIEGETQEAVDQKFSDRDIGIKLLKELKEKTKQRGFSPVMCCNPDRNTEGLRFWINTGGSTQIDGWKTEEEINEFLAGDGNLLQKDHK